MNGNDILCLMKQGTAILNNGQRDALFFEAREMYRLDKKRSRLKFENTTIIIRTSFKTASLGSASGICFVADLETDKGLTHVEYIVQMRHLDPEEEEAPWRPVGIPAIALSVAGRN